MSSRLTVGFTRAAGLVKELSPQEQLQARGAADFKRDSRVECKPRLCGALSPLPAIWSNSMESPTRLGTPLHLLCACGWLTSSSRDGQAVLEWHWP